MHVHHGRGQGIQTCYSGADRVISKPKNDKVATAQKAELLAFMALIDAKLEPATAYTTWCERESYSRHTRPAYGAGLPLPLSHWLPWRQRRTALRRFAGTSAEQV